MKKEHKHEKRITAYAIYGPKGDKIKFKK